MDETAAREVAQDLIESAPPGVPDAVLLEGTEDHDWCWVINWTTERALASRSLADAPPPGYGPVAVDKEAGTAAYLSSAPLPVALEMARRAAEAGE